MNLNYLFNSLFFVIVYLVAAIPFGLIIANFKGVDLRSKGSKNIGATNVLRTMGKKYGIIVFFLDGIKGGIPTAIAMTIFENSWIHILIGSIAIIGHSLSVFVQFKGGKGAATGIGVIFALSPMICGIIVTLAFLLIYFTRIVSLTTIICSLLTPLLFYAFDYPAAYWIVLFFIGGFIIFRHRSNIERLLQGKENKI